MAPAWMHASLLVSIVCLLFSTATNAEDEMLVEDEVDIRPGSQVQEYEMKLVDATCKFTYVAQGGTNEKWRMLLVRDYDSNEFICSIERESGVSYLYFQQFRLEILDQFYGKDFFVEGDNRAQLDPSEYKVSYKNAYVSQVDGVFQSKLSKVEVMSGRRGTGDEL